MKHKNAYFWLNHSLLYVMNPKISTPQIQNEPSQENCCFVIIPKLQPQIQNEPFQENLITNLLWKKKK
jgi:hypothetical protein